MTKIKELLLFRRLAPKHSHTEEYESFVHGQFCC